LGNTAVIGGAGFIGSKLAGSLGNVRTLDRSVSENGNLRLRIDVRDKEALVSALEGIETIYLLAAEHADDVQPSSLYYDVNVRGTQNVIEAAVAHEVRQIIFTSTVAVYGLGAPNASENTPPDPFNDYARSKWQAEQELMEWANADRARSLVIVRPSVVFGEGNRGNVYNLLRQLRSGRFLMVGSGKNRKSMAYVGNLVHFLERATEFPEGVHVFNYADKPDMDMARLVQVATDEMGVRPPRLSLPYPLGLAAGYGFDILARATGRRFPVSSIRVKKFCADTTIETGRLESTGFQPRYTLEEGLRRMIRADLPPSPHE
jgi:GlcNAc-P-P-Und epimerase